MCSLIGALVSEKHTPALSLSVRVDLSFYKYEVRLRILPPLWRLLILSLAWFAVMFFAHLPDHLILFPTRTPIDAGRAIRKTIRFEKGELEIWMAQSKKAQQQDHADIFILRFYGNADRADRWAAIEAEVWNDRAVEIW